MTSSDQAGNPALEWKLRAAAVPCAVAIALAFHASETGHFFQRTWLTMIPHEFGHAITAWWCGFTALPGLWKTSIPEARGVVVPLLVAAASGLAVVRGWRANNNALVVLGLVLGALQFVGTTSSIDHARAAMIFGGDAGAMVLGTAMILAFFVPPGTRLHATGLRWGLLAIGAATLVDTSATWWAARTNVDAIPFGEIEGVGLSDPSKLDEVFGWTTRQIVDRYVVVATACTVVVIAAWAWSTWAAYRRRSA